MSVALGTVFILNSIALLIFPGIGASLHLTQSQFGLWAALAIHDTSSVVGAGAKYGAIALAVATTVKLARALWIVPHDPGRRRREAAHRPPPGVRRCRFHAHQGQVALVHPVLRAGLGGEQLSCRRARLPSTC